jgi:hypothetical protein
MVAGLPLVITRKLSGKFNRIEPHLALAAINHQPSTRPTPEMLAMEAGEILPGRARQLAHVVMRCRAILA